MESEFGKGLIVNLVKFGKHFDTRIYRDLEMINYRIEHPDDFNPDEPAYSTWDFSIENWGNEQKYLSSQIALWANGASDHLYEIETIENPDHRWREINRKITELKEEGLTMGHGFTEQIYTMDDIIKLWDLLKQISIRIDKLLGLKPDWGKW